ncbi:hypothetical protein pneo_cds_792 [Pandoravirus neocaledonia]|uniref:Uncharacterized protein n=1 Tax=Pandoravirus neocaledonia TaxID=2107708 RepID=A0A2U7UD56_9VIRU|nr:hypothetical protein pneo_cds_792 [Pandoravirus neocaledonia]AVK76399.1 hypothetical protein pneo_cds_792 [Pandoravirus neocaledonia]
MFNKKEKQRGAGPVGRSAVRRGKKKIGLNTPQFAVNETSYRVRVLGLRDPIGRLTNVKMERQRTEIRRLNDALKREKEKNSLLKARTPSSTESSLVPAQGTVGSTSDAARLGTSAVSEDVVIAPAAHHAEEGEPGEEFVCSDDSDEVYELGDDEYNSLMTITSYDPTTNHLWGAMKNKYENQ